MLLSRLLIGFFAGLLLVAGACGGDGKGGVPSAELYADPEVCDVPCEVLIDSGVETDSEDGLTFTWDVGDGPVEGDARLLHTFETAGRHSVTLTVSDGEGSTRDTVTVLAEAQPKTSGDVDEAGGSVSHGDCSVTVPEGIAPAAFSIEIAELPSMVEAAARRLGAERFESLGSAYQITTLAKSSVAFDLAVKSDEAVGRDATELAWLLRSIAKPMPTPDSMEPVPSLAHVVSYVLEPVTAVDADGTVHGEIFGRDRAELVRLNAPLVFEPEPSDAATSKSSHLPVSVQFDDTPLGMAQAQYAAAVREGVRHAHDVLVTQKQFLWMHTSVKVHVVSLANGVLGEVERYQQKTIKITNALATSDDVKKVVSHEFFHLVQNWHTNWASTGQPNHSKDGWFLEGSASWAMDEVYDDILARYFAPDKNRFKVPLVKPHTKAEALDAYETVAFWKWAESEQPDIVKLLLLDRFAKTHTQQSATLIVQNTVVTDYLTGIKGLWPSADFLQFSYDSLYEKNYDTGERGENELWSNHQPRPRLGLPKVIEPLLKIELDDGVGDSEATAEDTFVILLPHLTTDMIEVQSKGLKGTLHVRFEKLADPLDARVFVLDKASNELQDSWSVRDLSKEHDDVTVSFDPDKRAVIMMVDPRWAYPSSENQIEGKLKVWIEDACGPIPSNVIDVTNDDELVAAVMSAGAGSVIRMSAGTFSPPERTWTLPDDGGELGGNLLLQDMTLAGAGEGETTFLVRGNQFTGLGLLVYGSATLRDFTIDSGEFAGVTAVAAKNLTLCNMTIELYEDDAIYFSQWPGGGDGFLGIYDSTLSFYGTLRYTATDLYCEETSGNITAEIRDSEINGWYVGVSYSNESYKSCSVNLTTDCKGFHDNELANVMSISCVPGDCTDWMEQCP